MFILQLVIVQLFIFGALIFFMRKLLHGQISTAAQRFERLNQENQKKREELMKKIEDTEKDYARKKTQLTEEIDMLRTQTVQETGRMMDEAKAKATQERERLINEALQTRETIRMEIMSEMEQKAIQFSKDLIAGFFSDEMKKNIHETLIKEVAEGIGEVNFENFQIHTTTAQLIVPEKLTADEKASIKKALKSKIGKDVELQEELKPELVAGVILRFGTFVVDGSLMNRLTEAAAKQRKETVRKYQKSL